jgi:hypothetical protein
MPTSPKQASANRLNAQKSRGPTSESGRRISSLNGLKHGLAAAATIIPTEDAREYDERVALVNSSLRPRSGLESILAVNVTRASWMIDRSIFAQRARLTSLIKERPQRELAELSNIYKRLFFDRRGPVHGASRYNFVGERTSCSDVPDHVDDPDTLVRKIQNSVPGCLWMLDRFAELRALLAPGTAWQAQHKFMFIRLLGKQPLDALTDREVAEVHLRTWTISPSPGSPWRTIRSELGREEYRNFLFQVSRQWPDMLDSHDDAKERQALIAIVDRAVEKVKIKAAMAAERAAQDATLSDECLSFDDSPEGERLRRYHLSFHRALLRSVEAFAKVRRAALDDGGDLAESEVENGEEHSPSPESNSPPCASPESFPPIAKGGVAGMVSARPIRNASHGGGVVTAPPVSNAPCEGGGSEGWSLRDEAAWLPTRTAANPGVSEPIDSSLTTGWSTTIGDDLAIGTIRSSGTIESNLTTVSCCTIDTGYIASAAEGPKVASDDLVNLQTEPNFRSEDEPNHPDRVEARNQPIDAPVLAGEPERHNADGAGCEDDPNRRLISTAPLLLSTILMLVCPSLLADAARQTPRAQGDESPRAATSSPALTRRASFDVAPSVRRPEGTATNQPRATPWEHVQQPSPSPDGAKQNSVFHGRLGHRDSRDLWRPYRARAYSESRLPGRCPGLACRFPFGAEFGPAQHENAPARGVPFPARPRPAPYRPDAPARGLAVSALQPRVLYQPDAPDLMLRLWIFAPNGAVTNQPRATPWEHVHHQRPSPVRAKQNLVFQFDAPARTLHPSRALASMCLGTARLVNFVTSRPSHDGTRWRKPRRA